VRLTLPVTAVAAGLATAAALSSSPRATSSAWQASQADLVREVVLRDLLTLDDRPPKTPTITVCIAIAEGPDSHSSMSERDASLELLTRLRSAQLRIAPLNSCRLNERDLLVDHEGLPALQLGVGQLAWVAPDFVKVEAYWLRGGLWAVGYHYTLSLVGTEWRVDRAAFAWVS